MQRELKKTTREDKDENLLQMPTFLKRTIKGGIKVTEDNKVAA